MKNGNPGTIKNIIFTNVSIDNSIFGSNAGAVAGYAQYTNISGIAVESGKIRHFFYI